MLRLANHCILFKSIESLCIDEITYFNNIIERLPQGGVPETPKRPL